MSEPCCLVVIDAMRRLATLSRFDWCVYLADCPEEYFRKASADYSTSRDRSRSFSGASGLLRK